MSTIYVYVRDSDSHVGLVSASQITTPSGYTEYTESSWDVSDSWPSRIVIRNGAANYTDTGVAHGAAPATRLDVSQMSLDDYKLEKNQVIDHKTQELIGAGFTFDSEVFSLSIPAQINWNTLKNSAADFTWPMDVTTIDDAAYSLSLANLGNFWGTAMITVKTHLDSGRALKASVNAATDKAGVDAVVDSR